MDPSSEKQIRDRYKILVDQLHQYAILMLNPDGHIVTWNQGAERILGYSETEVLGQHFSLFYPAASKATQFPEYELQQGSNMTSLKMKDGESKKMGPPFGPMSSSRPYGMKVNI